jgi:sulfate permease, SulP family
LERTRLFDKIGKENFYPDTKAAVKKNVDIVHHQTDLPEGGCQSYTLTRYISE